MITDHHTHAPLPITNSSRLLSNSVLASIIIRNHGKQLTDEVAADYQIPPRLFTYINQSKTDEFSNEIGVCFTIAALFFRLITHPLPTKHSQPPPQKVEYEENALAKWCATKK